MDPIGGWLTQVRRGLLEACILNALVPRERYGLELIKVLASVPELGDVKEGTIYPLLSRLKAQGWVTTRLGQTDSGPVRKYYTLTPAGKKAADRMNKHLESLLAGSRNFRKGGDNGRVN